MTCMTHMTHKYEMCALLRPCCGVARHRLFARDRGRNIERIATRARCSGHDVVLPSREALRAQAGSYYRTNAVALSVDNTGERGKHVLPAGHGARHHALLRVTTRSRFTNYHLP